MVTLEVTPETEAVLLLWPAVEGAEAGTAGGEREEEGTLAVGAAKGAAAPAASCTGRDGCGPASLGAGI